MPKPKQVDTGGGLAKDPQIRELSEILARGVLRLLTHKPFGAQSQEYSRDFGPSRLNSRDITGSL